MWSIIKSTETKYKIFSRENYPIPHCAFHRPSLTRSPISKQFWPFFGSADQGFFLLKWPWTSPPNRRKPNHLSFTTWLSSTNQNLTIFQACNCRNHKAFQLTVIFPFSSQCPHDYTRFFYIYCYLIFYYPMVRRYLSYLLLHTLFITSINTTILGPLFWNFSASTFRQWFTWFRLCWSLKGNVPE